MKCDQCRAEVKEDSVFCHVCGHRLAEGSAPEEPQEKPSTSARDRLLPTGGSESREAQVDDDETELWQGRYSHKAMIGTWILCGVVTIVCLAIVGIFFSSWTLAWVGVLVVLGILWISQICKFLYRRLSMHYRMTNHRFFHQSGILKRVTDRIELIDMDDITYEQGLVERMFKVGTILITSSDRTHPHMLLPGIDGVQDVAELIDRARRTERMKRSVHIESI